MNGYFFVASKVDGFSMQPSSCTPSPMSMRKNSAGGLSSGFTFAATADGSVSARTDLWLGSSITSVIGGVSNRE